MVNTEIKKMIQNKKIAGAITVVVRKGKIVHFEAHGLRDVETKEPIKKDTIMRFYSMSKPITTVRRDDSVR